MPRFAILEHHYQGVHWDFMLEQGRRLRTWRLATPPGEAETIEATPLPDHRLVYLDYEGEVSGGRGHVHRWDWGEFDWVREDASAVEVTLSGRRVRGRAYLRKELSGTWSFRLTSAESACETTDGS